MKQRRENSDFSAESCSESCLRLSSWYQTDPEVEFVNRSLPSHQNIYDFTFKHTGLDSLCSPVSNSMERNRYYVILSHSSARWHRMTTGGSVGPEAPVSLWVKVMKLPWLDVCERGSNVMLSSLSHQSPWRKSLALSWKNMEVTVLQQPFSSWTPVQERKFLIKNNQAVKLCLQPIRFWCAPPPPMYI